MARDALMPAVTVRRRADIGGPVERGTARYWRSLSRSKVRAWPCRRCGLPASYAARVEMSGGVSAMFPSGSGDSPSKECRLRGCSYGAPAGEKRLVP